MKTKQEKLTELFETLVEKGQFNGAILVAEKGRILAEAAYGMAELSTGRKLTVDSVFELASVSKPFTAAAIIHLEQTGRLNYEDRIDRWLPNFPYPGITIRHLLTHTSGLPDYMELFLEHWDHTRIACNEDVLDMLTTYKPACLFQPNEEWRYSNTGYVLLAVIVEKVSGLSFAEYMRENIFKPLEMNDTQVYNRRFRNESIADYAYGYVYDVRSGEYMLPDQLPETDYVVYLDGIQGDGTVNSTIRDLYRFDQALYGESFLNEQSKSAAFAPARMNNGETFDYGFGWIVDRQEGKGTVVSHQGGWPGYSTTFIRFIDCNKTIIGLSNMEQGYEFDQAVIAAVEQILFDQPYDIPERLPRQEAVAVDPVVLERYAGHYEFPDGPKVSVTIEAGSLFIQIEGQVRLELYASSQTKFFIRALPVEVEFITEEDHSEASGFILYQDGAEQQAQRQAN